jgi:hypothetical protein
MSLLHPSRSATPSCARSRSCSVTIPSSLFASSVTAIAPVVDRISKACDSRIDWPGRQVIAGSNFSNCPDVAEAAISAGTAIPLSSASSSTGKRPHECRSSSSDYRSPMLARRRTWELENASLSTGSESFRTATSRIDTVVPEGWIEYAKQFLAASITYDENGANPKIPCSSTPNPNDPSWALLRTFSIHALHQTQAVTSCDTSCYEDAA